MTGEKGGLLAGLRAEALKSRHAAPVRLAVLMALPMPLLGAMPYRGVQIFSAWNYWYALFLPVALSLVVACVARADARTRMRGLLGLGFPQIARARGVTLDAATGPAVAGAPEAPLDRTALARAAANLVANAAEHARSRVAVSCDVEGGHLVIEVSDDGPGFSPAALERGCERLFTDDSSRSSRDGGRHYGLGLHAASEAASAHGGSVSLANSPSGGAVATIAVPLCGA